MKKYTYKILLVGMFCLLLFPLNIYANTSDYEERTGIGTDKVWTIIFNQSVDHSSVKDNVFVEGETGKFDIDLIIKDKVIEVRPVVYYEENKRYKLVISDNLKNIDGELINSGFELSFTTGDDVVGNSLEYTYKTEYGNLVRLDRDGPVLISDLHNIEEYGFAMRRGFSKFNISIGDKRGDVIREYGEPLEFIDKDNIRYSILSDEYGTYIIDDVYVTFFYDTTRANEVRSIFWISEELESSSRDFYNIKVTDFPIEQEKLLLEVINETRRVEGLDVLKYDSEASEVSRTHSEDMAYNDFFDHVNLSNKAPSDRFKSNGVSYRILGENLAYGQRNYIFAHENLMNSLNHRENILNGNYKKAGVGIGIKNEGNIPYFTVNFYTD